MPWHLAYEFGDFCFYATTQNIKNCLFVWPVITRYPRCQRIFFSYRYWWFLAKQRQRGAKPYREPYQTVRKAYFILGILRTDLWSQGNRELKQQRFWATDVNRKWTFCSIGLWFGWNPQVNRLYGRKETQQYKFGSVQAYKKGKGLTSGWRASLKNVFA